MVCTMGATIRGQPEEITCMNDGLSACRGDKEARCAKVRQEMIAKWRSEMEHIKGEVVRLYHSRSIYERLRTIVNANPHIKKPNSLYEWLFRNYFDSVLMAIRRLVHPHKDALSLAKLVHSMKANQHVVTREWFVSRYEEELSSRYPEHPRKIANSHFDKLVGAGKDTIDGNDLQRRLEEIQSLSSLVLKYADKHVAHTDKNPPDGLLLCADLERAIDAVGELFKHVYLLLNQSSFVSLEPVESFRWERLFEEPWIVRSDSL